MTTQELVRIITMGVTAGAVPIILRYILKGKKNKKNDEQNIEEENTENGVEIRNPKAFTVVPMLNIILWSAIAIYIFVFDTEEWPYGVLFIVAFSLPCLIMYFALKLWKITVYRDHVVYRNSLGKKQTFYFQDMTWEFNEKMTKAIFYCNGKKRLFCAIISTIRLYIVHTTVIGQSNAEKNAPNVNKSSKPKNENKKNCNKTQKIILHSKSN